jgi:phage shock protein PspC (stress-responsive transcriptional regulator)
MSNDAPAQETPSPDFEPPLEVPAVEPLRLRRSRDRRVIAGVAGGIAERFDVNENLVRAIFIALTLFWGLGVALYLVLWVVVGSAPFDGVATSQREPTPGSTSHRLTIAVVAALVVLAALAVAVVRPVRVLGPGLAVAWIVFLVAMAIIAIRTPVRRLTFRRIVGVVFLAGVSFVIVLVGGFMGFLASTGVNLSGGNGDHLWQPTSLSQVSHEYHTEFGVGTLDLSAVIFPAAGFAVAASVAAGELRIVVPADAVVSLTTNVGAGVVTDTPVTMQGASTRAYSSLPPGVSVAREKRSPHLTIDARVGVGQIDLMRAASS